MTVETARQLAAYRGVATRIFLPDAGELAALGGDIDTWMPYAFPLFDSRTMVLGGLVGPQQVGNGYISQPEDCWITHLVGSLVADGDTDDTPAAFSLQIYDSKRQALWTPQPINEANVLGDAGEPFWLKRLYLLPAGNQLQCQVTNLLTVAAEIQVIAWGLRK